MVDVTARASLAPPALEIPAPRAGNASPRRRLALQVLALFGIYVALVLVCDPRGTLGSDTGAKVATLRVMQEHSTVVPTVGYWAKAQDPQGLVHPLLYSNLINGRFVNITTLPMLLAAYPLWALGGYRLALLIPILGAIGCALAVRGLARRLGARNPDLAFWVVGLASPVAVYALDLWEHTAGLALMLFGVAKMLDAGADEGRTRDALFAGLLFGGAASMRTEAFVYGFVTGAVVFGVMLWTTHNWRAVLRRGGAAVAGFVTMVVANTVLEQLVLGSSLRAGRASGAAGASGADVGLRLSEALTTSVGPNLGLTSMEVLSACCVTAFVVAVSLGIKRNWSRRRMFDTVLILGFPIALRVVAKPAFVPGFLLAFPMAALGIAMIRFFPRGQVVAAIAVGRLPLVWATEYVGGAGPQWGGRYVLVSSVLLGVVACVVAFDLAPVVAKGTLVLCVVITAVGVTYLAQRSRSIDAAGRRIAALQDDVVISRDGFLLRDFGAYYTDKRPWLTAWNDALLRDALRVADARHAHTLALITLDPDAARAALPGWHRNGTTSSRVTFNRMYVTQYVRAP